MLEKSRPPQLRDFQDRQQGFTLIELLVTIGVIAVVLSITIPVLKHARDRAIVARSLSGHRNVFSYTTAYSIDHNGRHPFPYIKREGSYAHPIYRVADTHQPGYEPASMALQARIWPSLFVQSSPGITPLVYQGRWQPIVGMDVPNGLTGGSFVATSTMFAIPQFFGLNTDAVNTNQLRPTHTAQIKFPSSKMLFEDLESWGRIPTVDNEYRSATFGFADGSAATMSQRDFSGDWVQRTTAWQVGPGHTTLNGLAGRDR